NLRIGSVVEAGVPPSLLGDAGRIRQVLMNLVSNAVKFTAEGEIVISTRCIARSGSDATIKWEVSDTGIGIAPDKVGTLFSNFVQADSSINRRFGGSGLGLAICKRLIEQMGGSIDLTSTPGRGSTFSVILTLPVAEHAPQADAGEQDGDAQLQALIGGLGRPLRVLIVDDNATNRVVAAKML
ncbi:ATP-binding protein, partial [Pseudomonas lurida]|uniref:ATP-binding protein n=1 Tax=Pseudomonas lurida TaxID=244566 RepID=UPI0030D9C265